jgi:integrase
LERIVDETGIRRLVALTTSPRDSVLLLLAYVSGLRIAELAALKWRSFGAT